MNKKIKFLGVSLFVVFGLIVIFSIGFRAYATEAPTRYLFESDNVFLKGFVGVQQELPQGFTSDLTPGQLKAMSWMTDLLQVKVSEVPVFEITQNRGGRSQGTPSPQSVSRPTTPAPANPAAKPETPGKGGGNKDSIEENLVRSYLPSNQVPWGIKKVYRATSLTATSGGGGINVAVLDTGTLITHLDISSRVAQCKDFTRKGIKEGCSDGNGHGTHVAGTILANAGADGLGIYGVAPEANLYAYKVCGNSGSCWADDIATGIRHAAEQGAHIISLSLGSSNDSPLIRDAVSYAASKGVLVIAASGNSGPDEGSINYPAAYSAVIAVGAIDSNEQVPLWSSRGINDGTNLIENRKIELAAPGVGVESTWADGSYKSISGTSMATPHVAGLAARHWQGSATLTRTYLRQIARDIWSGGYDTATGFGIPEVK
jgi:subtilisin